MVGMRPTKIQVVFRSRGVKVRSAKDSHIVLAVISLMNILGLVPSTGAFVTNKNYKRWDVSKRGKCCFTAFNNRTIVTWCVVHYYTFHTITSSVIYAVVQRDMAESLCNAAIVTRCVITSAILNLFLVKSDRVFKCFNSILSFERVARLYLEFSIKDTVPSYVKSSKAASRTLVGLASGYLAGYVITCSLHAVHLDLKEYVSMYLLNLRWLYHDVPEGLGRFFCFAEMMFSAYVVVVGFSLQAFLLVTVATLSLKLRRFRDLCSNYYSSVKYAELTRCHTDLFVLVRILDLVIGLPFVLWVIEWLANIAFNVPSLVTDNDESLFGMIYWFYDFVTPLWMSLVVGLALASIYSTHGELVYAAHRAVCKNSNPFEINHQRVSTFLIIKMYSAKIQVTIFHCFAVNKTFIISLYITVTTYIVFLTQEIQANIIQETKNKTMTGFPPTATIPTNYN